MCFLLAIGAAAEPWRLACLLERELSPRMEAVPPEGVLSLVFPEEDSVRVITQRGCSCCFFQAAPGGCATAHTAWLSATCRRALATAVRRLGPLRIYVRRSSSLHHRRFPRLTMTSGELLAGTTGLPTDVLIDLVPHVPPSKLN